jgi:hypothetical protein
VAAYRIFADNLVEAEWFRELSPLVRTAGYSQIGERGSNPAVVDDLIRYDRPDIVLLDGQRPVLVLEKTREVPTGHNVGQRFARLVRSTESGITTIKFFPFDARKHGDYSAICNLNIRLIRAFERMAEIHKVPVLAVNWPADQHGELFDDGQENERVGAVVHDFLARGHDKGAPEIVRQQEFMRQEYRTRLRRHPPYDRPPNSVEFVKTSSIKVGPRVMEGANPERFAKRENTLVYTMDMTPSKCRREDPYTGTQFIYDYIWCRTGPAVGDKHTNLVLRFPSLTRAVWYAANPNDVSRKSCNWYLTANALWFQDGLDLLR